MNNRDSRLRPSRRGFLQTSAAISAASLLPLPPLDAAQSAPAELPPAFAGLKPLGSRVQPIAVEEFRARLARAQKLMTDAAPRFDALFLAPGTSLYYFTGIRWGMSERLVALLLPRSGEPFLVCPAFEEGRLRELLRFPIEVRVWQEDESPAKLAAATLAERGVRTGRAGIEETVRFTFFDHFRRDAPGLECVSADSVTIGCRARKSPQELALLRLACEANCDVYRAVFASLQEGMSQEDLGRLVEAGFARMGLRGGALTLIGPSAAL
ncbi:MAG TPA: aminopeptidase P family N-terminal domain-containing protein, partial [Methylomirabilota bacterium]|nr:aminopeptidase P family N-terminal domain-containing protein [Methylomirabilota bacterium]